jgi:hypothetical protein
MSTKTIYTAEPQKFSFRIWSEMIWSLIICILVIGAIIIGTEGSFTFFAVAFVLFFPVLLGYASQYKYRFIQAVSIMEEDEEFVFELLYKDELYQHIIKKSNISTKMLTESVTRSYISKLVVFDKEKEVFALYSGSGIMKEADLEKIKVGLDN